MRFVEKQKQVEEMFYEALNEISDKLEIDFPYYPAVYWMGRKLKFEDLELPEKHRETFNHVKKKKISGHWRGLEFVIIAEDDIEYIAEESGHSLHYMCAGQGLIPRKDEDQFALDVIVEMIGFFCSRLVVPNRTNICAKRSDFVTNSIIDNITITAQIKKLSKKRLANAEFVHEQGYGLGDMLYNKFMNGDFSLYRLRKLFQKDFRKKGEAPYTFASLKKELTYI